MVWWPETAKKAVRSLSWENDTSSLLADLEQRFASVMAPIPAPAAPAPEQDTPIWRPLEEMTAGWAQPEPQKSTWQAVEVPDQPAAAVAVPSAPVASAAPTTASAPRATPASGAPAAITQGAPRPGASPVTGYAPSTARGAEGVERWSDLVSEAARTYNLPETTIKGLMEIESGGNPDAVSSAGAQGLMQVMPFHFKPGENPRDPRTNILRGAKVYADALARWGDPDKAAAAYFGAIDDRGNITNATDGSSVNGPTYVRLWREAAAKYGGAPTAARPAPAGAAAPSPPPPAGAPAGASPTAPAGASGDLVTIEHVDDGKRRQVPREQAPSWLRPVAPGMGPSWRMVDERSALDDARAGQGVQLQSLSLKASGDPQPMPEDASTSERALWDLTNINPRRPKPLQNSIHIDDDPTLNLYPIDPPDSYGTVQYRGPLSQQPMVPGQEDDFPGSGMDPRATYPHWRGPDEVRGNIGIHEAPGELIPPDSLQYPVDKPYQRIPPYGITTAEGTDPLLDRVYDEERPLLPLPDNLDELRRNRREAEEAIYRQPLGETVRQAPARDDWATDPTQPYDPDQGPREAGYTVPAQAELPAAPRSSQAPNGVTVYGPPQAAAGEEGGPYPSQAPDPDLGPREALPGSVGATPYLGPMSTQPELVTPAVAPAPPQNQVNRYVPSYAPQAAQVTPEQAPRQSPLETAILPALQTLDAANEWRINSPLGNLSLQGAGREIAGADQMAVEFGEDHARLERLIERYRAGDTSVKAEMDALAESLNRRMQVERPYRETILEAGERNPDKRAETLGSVAEAATTIALAPSLSSGVVRNIAAAGLDPIGQGIGAAVELPGRAINAMAPYAQPAIEAAGRAGRGLAEEAGRQLLDLTPMPRIVPPGEARMIPGGVRLPDDPSFVAAVEATPGARLTSDGLEIDVQRFQKPKQQGAPVSRGGVHYEPDTGEPGPFGNRGYYDRRNERVGGSQQIAGPTLFQRPLVVSGGATPAQSAIHALQGPEALQALDDEVWDAIGDLFDPTTYTLRRGVRPAQILARVEAMLTRHGLGPDDAAAVVNGWSAVPRKSSWDLRDKVLETIASARVRESGHDGIVATVPGLNRLGEILDVRESHYPTPEGGYTLRPEFQPKPAAEGAGAPSGRGGAPLLGRGIGAVQRRAGVRGGGALSTVGPTPPQRPTRAIQQALTEAHGRPYPPIRERITGATEQTLGQPSAEMLRDARMPREAVRGVEGDVMPRVDDVPPNMAGRMNAGMPFDPASAAAGGAWDPLESTCRHASLSIL